MNPSIDDFANFFFPLLKLAYAVVRVKVMELYLEVSEMILRTMVTGYESVYSNEKYLQEEFCSGLVQMN